jgi:hypothetical protein
MTYDDLETAHRMGADAVIAVPLLIASIEKIKNETIEQIAQFLDRIGVAESDLGLDDSNPNELAEKVRKLKSKP